MCVCTAGAAPEEEEEEDDYDVRPPVNILPALEAINLEKKVCNAHSTCVCLRVCAPAPAHTFACRALVNQWLPLFLLWLHSIRVSSPYPQLGEKKWSDKVAALDAALDLMKKVPKLSGEARDYADAIQSLKLFFGDSNQTVRGYT